MAERNAERFLENLVEDSLLRAKLRSAGAENIDGVVDFALAKGFAFTTPELKSALLDCPDDPFLDALRERLGISRVSHSL